MTVTATAVASLSRRARTGALSRTSGVAGAVTAGVTGTDAQPGLERAQRRRLVTYASSKEVVQDHRQCETTSKTASDAITKQMRARRRGSAVHFWVCAFPTGEPVSPFRQPYGHAARAAGARQPSEPSLLCGPQYRWWRARCAIRMVATLCTPAKQSPSLRPPVAPTSFLPAGRLLFELFIQRAPRAAEAFRVLCAGVGGGSPTGTHACHAQRACFQRVPRRHP